MDISDGGQRYWPRHMRGRPRHMATEPAPGPAAAPGPAPAPAPPRRRRLRTAAAIAGVAAGGLAACQPAPAAPKAAPVPDRVAVAGDSLVILAAMNGGDTSWADTQQKVGLGWQAEDAQPRLGQDVRSAATSPDVLVMALGQNDAVGTGGLTPEDRSQLVALLSTPHGSACVVLVKPHYAGTDPARRQGIEAYRAWVDQVAPTRPGTVVADWRPIAAAHPEYLAADGFHLERSVPAAGRAYTDLLREGARRCGAAI